MEAFTDSLPVLCMGFNMIIIVKNLNDETFYFTTLHNYDLIMFMVTI